MIHVRTTRAEARQWREKARAAGVPVSRLLREAMRRTRTWTAPQAQAQAELVRQVARCGNNLNQLARWANTYKSSADTVQVVAACHALSRELAALKQMAGGDADDD